MQRLSNLNHRIREMGVLAVTVFLLSVANPSASQAQTRDGAKEKPILTREELARTQPKSANPYVAFLPVGVEPDFRYWNAKARFDAEDRRASMGLPTELINVSESEPNDTIGTADTVPGFGTATGQDSSASLAGSISPSTAPTPFIADAEDNGQITLATDTELTPGIAKIVTSEIGDGPHGSSGSGSGDYDFFRIVATEAGQKITADVDTSIPFGDLDPFVALYDSTGGLVGFNDDDGSTYDSLLSVSVPAAGAYYLAVSGYFGFNNNLIGDPNDSASGPGAGSQGSYDLTLSLGMVGDIDFFAVDLRAGDVLGVALTGLAGRLTVWDRAGENRMGSTGDVSFIYPPESTLPSGLAGASLVAAVTGTHYISVEGTGSSGAYSVVVEAYRPVTETSGRQILFVDFTGPTVDPSTWGGAPGSVALSPLSSFLPAWGLGPSDEDAAIDSIMASLEENLDSDLRPVNNNFDVELRNSRDHADPFGQPNVSRLIVGGTIAELGISTIGIAESIDPGNFGLAEDAVILLDLLSAAASNPNSLNQYGLAGAATIIDLIGQGVGNITAHEAGHYLGSFHTEQFITPANIMDQGGNLTNTVGVGPDSTFGTVDDEDVDFIIDVFVPSEGFVGEEDTRALTAFGLSGGGIFADGFESGDTTAWD